MQVRTGTVTVTSGSPAIVGTNTSWLSTVLPGGMFLVEGDRIPYFVASVASDTEIALSAPYQGLSGEGRHYWITTSFTPNRSYPVPEPGDVDAALIVARAIVQIDADIPAGGGGGVQFLDDLLDVSTAGVSTGEVLTRLAGGSYGFSSPGVLSIDATSLGTGAAIYAGKVGSSFTFRTLNVVGATTATSPTEVTVTLPNPGEVNTGQNVGSGLSIGVVKDKVGAAIRFKGLRAGAGVTLVQESDDIVISSSGSGGSGGEANTASNVGSGGVSLFRLKSGVDLQFRSLTFDPARFTTALSGDTLTYTVGFRMPGLADLTGVSVGAATADQVLRKDSDGIWRGATLPAAGIVSVQSDPAPRLGAALETNNQRIIGIPGVVPGLIERPKAKSYMIALRTEQPMAFTGLTTKAEAGGLTVRILAGGVVIGGVPNDTLGQYDGGLQATVSTELATITLADAAVVAIGSQIAVEVAGISADAADFSFALAYRTA